MLLFTLLLGLLTAKKCGCRHRGSAKPICLLSLTTSSRAMPNSIGLPPQLVQPRGCTIVVAHFAQLPGRVAERMVVYTELPVELSVRLRGLQQNMLLRISELVVVLVP